MHLTLRLIFGTCLFATVAVASDYSPALVHVIEQLRGSVDRFGIIIPSEDGTTEKPLSFVGGCEVGMNGRPGEFFLLSPYFENLANESDVRLMLSDESPVVRVMAVRVLLRGHSAWKRAISYEKLLEDSQQIEVARGGCVIERMAVGELIKRMRADPDYFGDRWYARMRAEAEEGGPADVRELNVKDAERPVAADKAQR